jgi:glycosyltransferase involved in cell wall biosynthesis
MRKVLVITYYWPPSGKASIHWPLKIIKHLPTFGWLPSVLTVDEDTFSQKDESLVKEIPDEVKVFHANSVEPFDVYKKIIGKRKDDQLIASETISRKNKSLAHRLSIWIRMNLFIPDARIGWYFPAVKTGANILRKEKVDAIVSVGPPHTSHLVGKKLASNFKLPHVPVFIDPWTDIAYYKDFKRSSLTKKIDKHLEQSVLNNASAVVFVTKTMLQDYIKKYPFIKDKSNVLYWGYSEEEFKNLSTYEQKGDEKVIVHAGNIFSYQNPVNFWKQIKKEIDEGNKLKLKFIGTVDPTIVESISDACLNNYTEYAGFLPYKKMLEEICNADCLLVCATEPRHVPGKLFEYLRASKPIIAFGDGNNEVKEILQKATSGMIFGYEESGEVFFKEHYSFKTNKEFVEQFERKSISKELSLILKNISS